MKNKKQEEDQARTQTDHHEDGRKKNAATNIGDCMAVLQAAIGVKRKL